MATSMTQAMPSAAMRVKNPTASPIGPKKLGGHGKDRQRCGNSGAGEVLHSSTEAMAAKPAEHFLRAVWKDHHRKSHSQDQRRLLASV
jgi:hypothetical protein